MTSLLIANQSTAEAKSKFSEIIRLSQESPQIITNRGKPVSVILSISEYERLKADADKNSFKSKLTKFLDKRQGNFPEKLSLLKRKSRKPILF